MWVPTELGTVCKCSKLLSPGTVSVASGIRRQGANSCVSPKEPHWTSPGSYSSLAIPSTDPIQAHVQGQRLPQAEEEDQGSVSLGCLHKVLVRQRPSRKGKNQPKQLNKYTGGSWQTEEATRRASFRLRVMCSAPSRAQALLQAGRTHTHTHHRDKPHRGSVDSQGHLCLASTQLQQPAHKSSRAQAGDAVRSRNSSQEKHIHCRAQLRPGEGLLLLPD